MPRRATQKTAANPLRPSQSNSFVSRPPELPESAHDRLFDSKHGELKVAARTLEPEAVPGIPIGDWDNLFNAVKERLIRTVYMPDTWQDVAAVDLGAVRTRTAVLECVAALDQLHATVTAEMARREVLELEVFDANTSLAHTRAALLGMQEGERRALHLAAHDALTLLPHRAALVERITHEVECLDPRHSGFAVMFLDLDTFKSINDSHGHAAGDEILQIVAARLRRVVRAQDFVSRVGGDEFACLIGGLTDQVSLGQLAEKIADAVSAPCTLGAVRLTVQVSIGIAICPILGSTANLLLEMADLAMYAAKRQQTRYAFFSPDGADNWPALRFPTPEPRQQLLQRLS